MSEAGQPCRSLHQNQSRNHHRLGQEVQEGRGGQEGPAEAGGRNKEALDLVTVRDNNDNRFPMESHTKARPNK